MQTNPQLMEEIRHLLDEIRLIQAKIDSLPGTAREKLMREWLEISDTLHTKLKSAKHFRKDWLFFKYLNMQHVEVVLTPHAISIEPLNGCWMDVLYDSQRCDQRDYFDAVFAVLEGEGS